MNILPMLARIEGALGCNDLIEKMVLLSGPASAPMKGFHSKEAINLAVGYNSSPRSQTALDLTLWIAHQTRLATKRPVMVQVVYVAEDTPQLARAKYSSTGKRSGDRENALELVREGLSTKSRSLKAVEPDCGCPALSATDSYDQADRILWQARCLASEWRGSLTTHLRFGRVATELREVVEAEAAALLLLGCNSVNHPIVQKLGPDFPCPVLGIPDLLMPKEDMGEHSPLEVNAGSTWEN